MVGIEQIVAGEPRLRVLHQVFILSGCRDSRGHLNSIVKPYVVGLNKGVFAWQWKKMYENALQISLPWDSIYAVAITMIRLIRFAIARNITSCSFIARSTAACVICCMPASCHAALTPAAQSGHFMC